MKTTVFGNSPAHLDVGATLERMADARPIPFRPNRNTCRLRPAFRVAHLATWVTGLVVVALATPMIAAETVTEIPLHPGEKWWGGQVVYSPAMPYDATSAVKRSLHTADRSGTTNQSQPLLLSDQGRYVWNDGAFDFEFASGVLKLSNAAAGFETGATGTSLRDGFREAAKRFFPASGKMPAELLFTRPQYNTWIELLHNQEQDKILKYARDLVAAGYPPGVLMIDDNWQDNYGVLEFSPRRFKDPKAMINELHALGFKVMLWVSPFISPDSASYRDLLRDGCLLLDRSESKSTLWAGRAITNNAALIRWWNGASAVLDFSNPRTGVWFRGVLQHLVDEYGVDGFKFDAGDSIFYEPTSPGRVFTSFSPRTPEEHCMDWARVGLDFPLNEYRACWRLAGEPLAQRLRDKDHTWEALRELIPGMITNGLLGYAFTCPDMIGGGEATSFSDPARFDPELVVRSAQVHALMPMMQFSVAPWRVLNPEFAAHCLAAARLHTQFGARILEIARESAKTGEPIVRPLEWRWPHQGYVGVKDQFMLGDDLLVAPVVAKGARSRTVVLPPGRWLADDGATFTGPATIMVQAPLNRLPFFLRDGAALP